MTDTSREAIERAIADVEHGHGVLDAIETLRALATEHAKTMKMVQSLTAELSAGRELMTRAGESIAQAIAAKETAERRLQQEINGGAREHVIASVEADKLVTRAETAERDRDESMTLLIETRDVLRERAEVINNGLNKYALSATGDGHE